MRPKNRADLVSRLEERWMDVLDVEYVRNAGWDSLRRIVVSDDGYLKPKDVVSDADESSRDDE